MGSLTLHTRRDGARSVVALSGELDLASVGQLRDVALAELAEAECQTLVLDLTDLDFMDSTGIGSLIDLRNRTEAAGRELALESVPPSTRRTLAIAGLAKLFGLEANA